MKTQKMLGAAVMAACVVFSGAAAADCGALNGYTGSGTGSTDPATTWGAIGAATGYFGSAAIVKDCKVKDQIFSTKRPPRFELFSVGKGMNGDQCALYKMSASIDSMIRGMDKAGALGEATALKLYVGELLTAGEVDATLGGQIQTAAVAVEQCLAALP